MNMFSVGSTRLRTFRSQGRSLAIVALSTVGLVLAGVPGPLGHPSSINLGMTASAQEESVFSRYVRAAYSIEKLRQPLIKQVKELNNGNVPDNVCSQDGIQKVQAKVRDQVQSICREYYRKANEIRDTHKLSRDQFNDYYRRSDEPGFRQQVIDEIRRLGLQ